MKKLLFIAISILVVAAAIGGYLWKNSFCGSCPEKGKCNKTSGNYNLKMSLCCERGCAAKNYAEDKIVANSIGQNGELVKCPVSGVVFKMSNHSGLVSYSNKNYHTCCGSCANIFRNNPELYAVNLN